MPRQNLPGQQKTVKSLNNNQEYIEKLIYIEKPYCFHFNMQNSKISYFQFTLQPII